MEDTDLAAQIMLFLFFGIFITLSGVNIDVSARQLIVGESFLSHASFARMTGT